MVGIQEEVIHLKQYFISALGFTTWGGFVITIPNIWNYGIKFVPLHTVNEESN